jgi:hypothetical protein
LRSFLKEDMANAMDCVAIIIQSYLRNLSLTSRQLNFITNPHLYEAPMTNHPMLLIRTLLDYPALASLVKSLSHRLLKHWPSQLVDLGPKFVRLVREYNTRLVQHRRSERRLLQLLGGWYNEDGSPDSGDDDGKIPWNERLFEAVTIGLLPNLADICLTAWLDGTPILPGILHESLPHLVSARIKYSRAVNKIDGPIQRPLKRLSLIAPNIRSLALNGRFSSTRSTVIEEFWNRRMGNELAAPNSPSHTSAPLFPHVTQLCLNGFSFADWESQLVPAMLHAFPALDSLHIDIEPREMHRLNTQAVEADLLEHFPGLRRLLVINWDFPADIPNDGHGHWTWSPRLAGAKKLQVLHTGLHLIRRDIDPALPPLSPLSADWLVRIMPPSLEVLAVRACDFDSDRHVETLVPALRGLAEAVEMGAFPVFKALVFPGGIVSERELFASFEGLEKQGVEVVTEAWLECCMAPGKSLGCIRSYDQFLQA